MRVRKLQSEQMSVMLRWWQHMAYDSSDYNVTTL